MKTIAIIQPSFIPWRGYFSFFNQCDVFVFYDDVQYDKHGWRNRNQIKTHSGLQWVSVPVLTKGHSTQKILEAKIDYTINWQDKVLKSIRNAYIKAPHFENYFPCVQAIISKKWDTISNLDIALTTEIAQLFEIKCSFHKSSDIDIPQDFSKVRRLIHICQHFGANQYLSGPSAKDYIDAENLFPNFKIELKYISYDFPIYEQLHGEFQSSVSILDLLFNCGPDKKLI